MACSTRSGYSIWLRLGNTDGGQANAHSPRYVRLDWLATHARGGGCLRKRYFSASILERDRSTARFATLWRTLGTALVRCSALRGYRWRDSRLPVRLPGVIETLSSMLSIATCHTINSCVNKSLAMCWRRPPRSAALCRTSNCYWLPGHIAALRVRFGKLPPPNDPRHHRYARSIDFGAERRLRALSRSQIRSHLDARLLWSVWDL